MITKKIFITFIFISQFLLNNSYSVEPDEILQNPKKGGKNDEEIYKFLTDRYGDFILLKPAFKLNTLALWLLPFVFVLVGIFIVFFHNKKSKKI